MPGRAHDDVVVHRDAERLSSRRDRAGEVDVGAAGGRVAARVIVDQAAELSQVAV